MRPAHLLPSGRSQGRREAGPVDHPRSSAGWHHFVCGVSPLGAGDVVLNMPACDVIPHECDWMLQVLF